MLFSGIFILQNHTIWLLLILNNGILINPFTVRRYRDDKACKYRNQTIALIKVKLFSVRYIDYPNWTNILESDGFLNLQPNGSFELYPL